MLDFAQLTTPARHGDVLVDPLPRAWLSMARNTKAYLGQAQGAVAGQPLSTWRRETRLSLLGTDDRPAFVLGHQPEFMHPGVWAKHVVAQRAAAACDGMALNLIVDSDVPKDSALRIPVFTDDEAHVDSVRFVRPPSWSAHEQIPDPAPEDLTRAVDRVARLMGEQFQTSLMPQFLHSLTDAPKPSDWVTRMVHARQAVEKVLEINLHERRVSTLWCTPLVVDMLHNAERFAASYNRALARYRRDYGIRGAQRPMPDLTQHEQRTELPLWVVCGDRPRRRLFVSASDGVRCLFAGDEPIGEWRDSAAVDCDQLQRLRACGDGWELRPRALALTIWARLLLADVFVHGIGGAKYDRISDTIIADYYGIVPPPMACVSATLHLGWAGNDDAMSVMAARRLVRDAYWNPQRHLPNSAALQPLVEARQNAVRSAVNLRNKDAQNRFDRRQLFREIREHSRRIRIKAPEIAADAEAQLHRARKSAQRRSLANNREFFFGLYDKARIRALMRALPDTGDFRL